MKNRPIIIDRNGLQDSIFTDIQYILFIYLYFDVIFEYIAKIDKIMLCNMK